MTLATAELGMLAPPPLTLTMKDKSHANDRTYFDSLGDRADRGGGEFGGAMPRLPNLRARRIAGAGR